jgi:hypothetical protein
VWRGVLFRSTLLFFSCFFFFGKYILDVWGGEVALSFFCLIFGFFCSWAMSE